MKYDLTIRSGLTSFETRVEPPSSTMPIRLKLREGTVDIEVREIHGKPCIVIESGPEIEVRQAGGKCAVVKFK